MPQLSLFPAPGEKKDCFLNNLRIDSDLPDGAVAQLEERVVRNDEVVGSIPISSTIPQK